MRSALAAIVVFTLLVPAQAEAFLCTRSVTRPFVSLYWPSRLVRWGIRSPGSRGLSSGVAQSVMEGAFQAWEEVRCSDLRFSFEGTVGESVPLDTLSQIAYLSTGWSGGANGQPDRDPGALALTTMSFNSLTGEIRFGVIEVNERDPTDPTSTGFELGDILADGCANTDVFDLGAVLTHEVGHFLGLAHTDSPGDVPDRRPTMTARVPSCDASFRTLEADDLEGLCTLYPADAPARQCVPIPAQDGPYVTSAPFACSTGRPGPVEAVVFVVALLRLSRRRGRACSGLRGSL